MYCHLYIQTYFGREKKYNLSNGKTVEKQTNKETTNCVNLIDISPARGHFLHDFEIFANNFQNTSGNVWIWYMYVFFHDAVM